MKKEELEKILKELCKYMVENDEKIEGKEWAKLYEAKEKIKEVIKESE